MRVLIASSEVAPFAKTGGLADVAGALPKALAKLGHDVRVILPHYRAVDAAKHALREIHRGIPVPVAGRTQLADLREGRINSGVPVYLVGCDPFFDRDGLYQTAEGDHPDNPERFAFFSRAVLETCRVLDFSPEVLHCNDWQTGLVPTYLRTVHVGDPFFARTGTLFTVHNLGYQGLFGPEALEVAGLGREIFNPFGIEFYGKVNYLKGGLVFSDVITTVSKKYAQEIQMEEFGYGLEGVLRARNRDLFGILNGIDTEEWSPLLDRHIDQRFSAEDLAGKAACKADLQAAYGLPRRPDVPVLAVISRLAEQKGIDLLADVLETILALDTQLVLLGSGEAALQDAFLGAQRKWPERVGVTIGFDVPLSHKIEAGADMFLMPSRYEPCGLNQMYSLAYGTIPVVRATGGLDDTIIPFEPESGQGTGFKFAEASGDALLAAVREAVAAYRRPEAWARLQRNAMACDFSWERSAREYEILYRQIQERKAG